MRAWGQVEGRRIDAPEDVDRWRDCGASQEAIDRHVERGQRVCGICLDGARRREVERETLAAMGARSQRAANLGRARHAACGTEGAKRRHARHSETCEACGVRDGRSARGTRVRS